MSLLEQQSVLAKLYTDERFRKKFENDPQKIGGENKLSKNEIAQILEILPAEIIAFADSLFQKRLREVERFLPITRNALEKDFARSFQNFAQTYTPHTVKKHLEDAIEFAEFLQKEDINPGVIKDLAKFEQAKLEFGGYGKHFVCRKFNFDLRAISHKKTNITEEYKKRLTFGVWFKFGQYQKHFFV
jgi:hypothetical protein